MIKNIPNLENIMVKTNFQTSRLCRNPGKSNVATWQLQSLWQQPAPVQKYG